MVEYQVVSPYQLPNCGPADLCFHTRSESWTFDQIYLCVHFKSTWHLAEMFCSCTLRDTCLRRYIVVNCPKLGSDLTHPEERACVDAIREVSKSDFCFINMLRSLSKGACVLCWAKVPKNSKER